MSSLTDFLGGASSTPPPNTPDGGAKAETTSTVEAPADPPKAPSLSVHHPELPMPSNCGGVTAVEVEAVLAGALMRITFGVGTNPAEVPDILKQLDANVKFREDFPRAGFGGKRETKVARALVLTVEAKDSGKFINITAHNAGEDLTIAVSRKNADDWLPKLEALGKVSDEKLAKIRAAFDNRKAATVILSEAEQFGCRYFELDGKGFLDEMLAEPPAAERGAE